MQIFLAKDIALESRYSQEELWDRILRDDYMKYAVEECYCAVWFVLTAILDDEGKMWFVYLTVVMLYQVESCFMLHNKSPNKLL